MEQKIIDIEYSQLSLQQKVLHTKKIVDLSLIIQLHTYRVWEMTITIRILIGSSSIDEKWKGPNLSYYNIYKICKIYNRKWKGWYLNHLDFFPFSVFTLYALVATMMGINSSWLGTCTLVNLKSHFECSRASSFTSFSWLVAYLATTYMHPPSVCSLVTLFWLLETIPDRLFKCVEKLFFITSTLIKDFPCPLVCDSVCSPCISSNALSWVFFTLSHVSMSPFSASWIISSLNCIP